MIYNELGNSGLRVSALSFGTMRWTSESACREIIGRGMDLGMNYADTSSGYVGGKSDRWTADAVRSRRADILFSAKSNWATAPSAKDVLKIIRARLKLLRLEYFDLYQVWGLGSADLVNAVTRKGGTLDGIEQAKRDGLVRCGLGFTFHGPDHAFKAAVDSGAFLSATISYSLINRSQEKLLGYAAARGVGVIVMNPLAGGVLAMADDPRLGFLRTKGTGTWYGALRFLLANKHIATSLIGFTVPEQVEQNIRALANPTELTPALRRSLAARIKAVKLADGNFCTGCGYCKDCPHGFNPTEFMTFMRDFSMYGMDEDRLGEWIRSRYEPDHDAKRTLKKCIECGLCLKKCPQKLPIVQQIQKAKMALNE